MCVVVYDQLFCPGWCGAQARTPEYSPDGKLCEANTTRGSRWEPIYCPWKVSRSSGRQSFMDSMCASCAENMSNVEKWRDDQASRKRGSGSG
ncbi:hypothetical protein VSDG_09574 [Cytospora chrysosperma]|uniref:Uncharacterized protein n=1 Tax=Cytospora chrysosperma TaxID=252740 RepID=A0A423VAC1_CYTCH|nr:hypothetical protein VSDG_09574 [Valsa sordida]